MTDHLKLLHAGDFHLGEPVGGTGAWPEACQRELIEAPYHAVRRLIELAIEGEADALLLAGNLLDPRRCGGHALAFLLKQFQLLAEHRLPVFWALGPEDRRVHWPSTPPWPDNVHVFSHENWSRQTVVGKSTSVEIAGRSWGDRGTVFERTWPVPSREDRPLVVVASLPSPQVPSSAKGVYWALGGLDEAQTVNSSNPRIAFCGTPQPRRSEETVRGSASWVEITGEGLVRSRQVGLAPVVHLKRSLHLEEITQEDDLELTCAAAIEEDLAELERQLSSSDGGVGLWLAHYRILGLSAGTAWRHNSSDWCRRVVNAVAPRRLQAGEASLYAAKLEIVVPEAKSGKPPEETLLADLLELLAGEPSDLASQAEVFFDSTPVAPWWSDVTHVSSSELVTFARHWSWNALGSETTDARE